MPSFRDLHLGAPDYRALRAAAVAQDGLFTVEEARGCGFSRGLLSHHARAGHFHHARRGIYRWPGPDEAPPQWGGIEPGPHARVRLEWMTAGRPHAVVSHSTALWMLGLMDEEPWKVHLTLDRRRRGTVPSREVQHARRVRVHLVPVPLREEDRMERHGIAVTAAERSIADAARAWESPIVLAEAIARGRAKGWVEPGRLLARARRRGQRVQAVVTAALEADERGFKEPTAPWL